MILKVRTKRNSRATGFGRVCRGMLHLALLSVLCGAGAVLGQEPLEDLSGGAFGEGEKRNVGRRNDRVASGALTDNPWFNNNVSSGFTTGAIFFYPRTRNKSWYSIFGTAPPADNRAFGDPNYNAKAASIRRAVKAMTDRNLDTTLLWGAAFNCSNDRRIKSQAIKRSNAQGRIFAPVVQIHVGPDFASPMRGPGSSVAATYQRRYGFDGRAIDILHLIGHVLYERDQTAAYYDLSRTARTASQVSKYAEKNMNEFIAEVFAGMMIGHQWPRNVVDEYNGAWIPRAR